MLQVLQERVAGLEAIQKYEATQVSEFCHTQAGVVRVKRSVRVSHNAKRLGGFLPVVCSALPFVDRSKFCLLPKKKKHKSIEWE